MTQTQLKQHRDYFYTAEATSAGKQGDRWQGELTIYREGPGGSLSERVEQMLVPGDFDHMSEAIDAAEAFAPGRIDEIRFADWVQTHLAPLFPANADFTLLDDKGVRISWPIPEEGRIHRRSRPIAIHFATEVATAIRRETADRRDQIGKKAAETVERAKAKHDPQGSVADADVIELDTEILDK